MIFRVDIANGGNLPAGRQVASKNYISKVLKFDLI
jgi:hypothetical protein